MAMLDTQIDAYHEIEPRLPAKRRAVYECIDDDDKGRTLFELVRVLGWPVNCVSGRVTELHKAAQIVDTGKRRVNPDTGKSAAVYTSRRRWVRTAREPLFHKDGQGELF